jgi:hypothetical protein
MTALEIAGAIPTISTATTTVLIYEKETQTNAPYHILLRLIR